MHILLDVLTVNERMLKLTCLPNYIYACALASNVFPLHARLVIIC